MHSAILGHTLRLAEPVARANKTGYTLIVYRQFGKEAGWWTVTGTHKD
jgi:hypothetical protein